MQLALLSSCQGEVSGWSRNEEQVEDLEKGKAGLASFGEGGK